MAKNQEISWLLQEKYHGVATPEFDADCKRLAAGEPLAYLIGSIPFLDCTIHLDSHPLIPRPETEFWVEKAITAISEFQQNGNVPSPEDRPRELPRSVLGRGLPLRVLDLCAGSGAIGVAVGKAVPEAAVTFGEIDPAHLPTILKNTKENFGNTHNRLGVCEVVQSDLFSTITGQFDFILTNPPYVDKKAGTVDSNVEAFEPHLALFGGNDGMEIIERIIIEAPTHLTANGQLWIEHEPFQCEAIQTLASANHFSCTTYPDQYGTARYSVLIHTAL